MGDQLVSGKMTFDQQASCRSTLGVSCSLDNTIVISYRYSGFRLTTQTYTTFFRASVGPTETGVSGDGGELGESHPKINPRIAIYWLFIVLDTCHPRFHPLCYAPPDTRSVCLKLSKCPDGFDSCLGSTAGGSTFITAMVSKIVSYVSIFIFESTNDFIYLFIYLLRIKLSVGYILV